MDKKEGNRMRCGAFPACVRAAAIVLASGIGTALPATAESPQKASLDCGNKPSHRASEMLLGQNLEDALDAIPGMLSDRLDNPKFLGPPDAITGIAPDWRHNSDDMNAVRCELTPGAGMSGNAAQMIQNLSPNGDFGILQNNRKIRAGEQFEVELWARAWNRPVTVKVGLLPLASRFPPYSEATIQIDAPYYKRYQAALTSPKDDDEAAFYCAIHGQGAIWVDQIHLRKAGEGLLCKELLDRISEMRIPVLRFPGGVASTVYRWRYGTGPVELRPVMPDPAFKRRMYYDFGTDEFLDLCLRNNTVPQITVNIGFGTPEEAGSWAAYCAEWYKKRNVSPPSLLFAIGNHPYLSAELAHMTPEMYVDTLRAYAPQIRANYPKARIMAVSEPQRGPWRSALLDKAADLFDLVVLQGYAWQSGQMAGLNTGTSVATANNEAEMASVVQGARTLSTFIREMIEDCKSRGLSKRVAFAEWNLWAHASHRDGKNFYEPYDAEHGLFTACMIHEFARLAPDLELANFYHLVNPMGMFIHRGPEVVETCIARVFKMYRPAFPGDVLPVAVVSPRMGEFPVVDAIALANGAGKWLYVVNRHPTMNIELEISGVSLKNAEVMALAGDSPLGELRVQPTKVRANTVGLPPLSLTRIHVGAKQE